MRAFRATILQKTKGFTLVEILVVILVLGIFITFASANWSGLAKKGKDALIERFSINIAMIREKAIAEYENEVVEFDIGEGKVRVGNLDANNQFLEAGGIELAEGFRIRDVVVNGQTYPSGKCYMTLRADGTLDRVILHLEEEEKDEQLSLVVNPLTGQVTGENGYFEEIPIRDRNNPS